MHIRKCAMLRARFEAGFTQRCSTIDRPSAIFPRILATRPTMITRLSPRDSHRHTSIRCGYWLFLQDLRSTGSQIIPSLLEVTKEVHLPRVCSIAAAALVDVVLATSQVCCCSPLRPSMMPQDKIAPYLSLLLASLVEMMQHPVAYSQGQVARRFYDIAALNNPGPPNCGCYC
jgi:hypothetical protein